ncbi:unnamed protein product, partial [Ectocarpus sp. 6 AP-2014]
MGMGMGTGMPPHQPRQPQALFSSTTTAAATGLGIPQNQIHVAPPTGAGGVGGGGGANSGGVFTPGLVPGAVGFMPATAAAAAAA